MKLFSFSPLRLVSAVLGWLALAAAVAHAQATLPGATVGSAYSYQVATNPAAPAGTVYSASGLPTGLSINASSGLISGIPTTAGTFAGTISLTSDQITNSFGVSIAVSPAAGTPAITSATTASGTVGQAFSYTVTADNSPSSFNVGALPAGLAFVSPTITGTPTVAGTSSIALSANNATGTGATRTLTLTIAPAGPVPAITSATTATAALNAAFTYQIVATNAPTSYAAAPLPFGLTLDSSTGLVSGTPTVAGIYNVGLGATNANGTSTTTNLTLTVGNVSAINSAATASFTVGQSGSFQLAATNSPLSYNVTGLPPGLAVNSTTGVISGAATATGTFTVSVSANNATGTGPASTLTLTVSAAGGGGGGGTPSATAPIFTLQPVSQTATQGATVSFTAAVAGTAPIALQWRKDGFPIAGATATTLTLTNVQTADAGAYVLSATNTAGFTLSQSATLAVTTLVTPAVAPTIVTAPLAQSATVGGSATFSVTANGTAPLTYQWLRDGAAVSGATGATLTLPAVTSAQAGQYSVTVSNTAGSVTSTPVALTVSAATAPTIATAPVSRTIGVGGTATLTVAATGSAPLSYQWFKDDVAISGATSATLTVANVTAANTGSYTVRVTNSAGSATTTAAILAVLPSDAQIVNLSTRGQVGSGERVLIAGFVITGTAPKPVLIRAAGPSLAAFGVPGALADPTLEIFNSASASLATNDNWSTAANASAASSAATRVGAFSLASADSMILTTLTPGAYSAVVRGAGTGTGVGLVEIYDASETVTTSRLINVSTRGEVGLGNDVLIAGVVVTGTEPKRILVRAAGPALANFGLTGVLANPRVQIVRGTTTLYENDDWGSAGDGAAISAAATSAGAFGLTSGSRDAALLVTLPPGVYSAVVSNAGTASGTALVEVYELP